MDSVVDQGANGGNVIVAIVDSGVDRDHPDLVNNIAGGEAFDYIGGNIVESDDYEDDDGHGTKVAGVVGGVDNQDGVLGCAPYSSILALRLAVVVHQTVAYAISYAADIAEVRVIVIPLWFSINYSDIKEALTTHI